jgi:sigma-B regulation protein RsbU (phosphoserine phosphatase)
MVGGDFYDVWPAGEDWMAIIGDVTGKGIEAAALTALVRHTVRAAAEFERSPARLLGLVDETLKKRPVLSVCTALCLRLRDDTVTLAAGGHPLPVHITPEGVGELGEYGPLLGAFEGVSWRELTVSMAPGQTLLAFTDGVTDARSEQGERFGMGRLYEALADLPVRSAAAVIAGVSRKLEEFQTAAHADDTAAIVLHRLGHSEGPEDFRQTPLRAHAPTITQVA